MDLLSDKQLLLANNLLGEANPYLLHSYIESEQPVGSEYHYQVLLMYGNEQTVQEIQREKIILQKKEDKWYVTGLTPLGKTTIDFTPITGSDEESMQQLRSFINACKERDEKRIKSLLAPSLEEKFSVHESKEQLFFNAMESVYIEGRYVDKAVTSIIYDIIKAERKNDLVAYTISIREAVEDEGIKEQCSFQRIITLQKLNAAYQIVNIEELR